ncbi:hypothetical protein GCM10027056_27180 [Glaciibacter psychrotolerans]
MGSVSTTQPTHALCHRLRLGFRSCEIVPAAANSLFMRPPVNLNAHVSGVSRDYRRTGELPGKDSGRGGRTLAL